VYNVKHNRSYIDMNTLHRRPFGSYCSHLQALRKHSNEHWSLHLGEGDTYCLHMLLKSWLEVVDKILIITNLGITMKPHIDHCTWVSVTHILLMYELNFNIILPHNLQKRQTRFHTYNSANTDNFLYICVWRSNGCYNTTWTLQVAM
jgi:hypothetical protein